MRDVTDFVAGMDINAMIEIPDSEFLSAFSRSLNCAMSDR